MVCIDKRTAIKTRVQVQLCSQVVVLGLVQVEVLGGREGGRGGGGGGGSVPCWHGSSSFWERWEEEGLKGSEVKCPNLQTRELTSCDEQMLLQIIRSYTPQTGPSGFRSQQCHQKSCLRSFCSGFGKFSLVIIRLSEFSFDRERCMDAIWCGAHRILLGVASSHSNPSLHENVR